MTKYYECHITLADDLVKSEEAVVLTGWKFSKIYGDPVLGKHLFSYATKHYSIAIPEELVVDAMGKVFNQLKESGLNVIRQKVELVVYDSKQR